MWPAGRPTSLSAPAKPKPCSRPKAKATIQGARAAMPDCAVSRADDLDGDEDDRSAIAASTGAGGTWTKPSAAAAERDAVRDREGGDRL